MGLGSFIKNLFGGAKDAASSAANAAGNVAKGATNVAGNVADGAVNVAGKVADKTADVADGALMLLEKLLIKLLMLLKV